MKMLHSSYMVVITTLNCHLHMHVMNAASVSSCANTLTESHPYSLKIDYSHRNISSCRELVGRYTTLCRDKVVAKQLCCKACQQVEDLSCLDDFKKPKSSFTHADLFYDCRSYVKDDPCRCAPASARRDCCVSCKKVDLSTMNCKCRNILDINLRPAYLVYVSISYDNQPLVDRERISTNCKPFKRWYPNFCGHAQFHKIHKQLCCQTCKEIDHKCIDNLYWRANIYKSNKTCEDCTCHDIRKVSRGLMRKACRDDIPGTNLAMGAREACCHQCKRLGYPKPANYVADHKLTANVHVHFVKSPFEWILLVG